LHGPPSEALENASFLKKRSTGDERNIKKRHQETGIGLQEEKTGENPPLSPFYKGG
jgi:hypothetical protein